MASDEFSKMSTTWYFDGFEECKRLCSKKFPSTDFSVVELEDDTTSLVDDGDQVDDTASTPVGKDPQSRDLGGKPQTISVEGQTSNPDITITSPSEAAHHEDVSKKV